MTNIFITDWCLIWCSTCSLISCGSAFQINESESQLWQYCKVYCSKLSMLQNRKIIHKLISRVEVSAPEGFFGWGHFLGRSFKWHHPFLRHRRTVTIIISLFMHFVFWKLQKIKHKNVNTFLILVKLCKCWIYIPVIVNTSHDVDDVLQNTGCYKPDFLLFMTTYRVLNNNLRQLLPSHLGTVLELLWRTIGAASFPSALRSILPIRNLVPFVGSVYVLMNLLYCCGCVLSPVLWNPSTVTRLVKALHNQMCLLGKGGARVLLNTAQHSKCLCVFHVDFVLSNCCLCIV